MKTIINNLIKTAFVLSFMFFGAVFADAANFDMNPYGGSTDFASINDCIGNCANQDDDLYVNIPNPGDSKTFHVFLDFRNESSGTITNPTARITYPEGEQTSSSATFQGRLSGGGASSVTDTTRLSGLPDRWEIDFISGYVDVPEHYSGNTSCSALYGINFSYEDDFSNPGNVSINNDLRYQYGEGWCDQGFVIATFEVTNRESNDPQYTYSWETSSWGACINGVKYRDVWCEQNPGGQEVNNSYCSGAMPSTSSTVGCDDNNDTLTVDTDAPNINDYSVTLNGEIQSGSSNNHYFVLGDGPNISCNSLNGFGSDDIQTSASAQDGTTLYAGGDFSHYISFLADGDYWYVACAGLDTDPASGIIRNFTIDNEDEPSNGSEPDAVTEDEDDVDEDSATLEGKIRMNDFDNGIVFFVYGQDESDIEDVEDEDEYSDIDEDGDNIQKEEVDDNNDEDGWESYDLDIDGLDTDERYYYRICVEFDNEDGDEELVCGDVEDFKTDDDDDNNDDSDIETRNVDSITESSAKICGDLNDDGGDNNLRTWMEYRKSTSSSYTRTDKVDRGEGYYCVTVRNLSPDTRYYYRACSDDGCDSTRSFTTDDDGNPSNEEPIVTTDNAYNIRSNSAILPGTYVTNANSGVVWFQYGRSEVLNRETRRYTKYGAGGGYIHNFTNLAANQRYCYRAVIQTVNGTDYGSTKCFSTLPSNPGPVDPEPPVVVVIEEDDDLNIDLSQLGLGLSLIRLEIDDDRETVTTGENVTYEITWENISEIDLDDLDLNITIPREVQITSSSRGRLDQDRNAIFYTIDDLEAGEENSMTVTGIVTNGNLGDALTAEATIAFDNPINDAQENATDYDVDEYVVPIIGGGTASVFGLANITLLGWLTILLGLFIVFLVARWLYLEREELRAQAYVNGYGRTPYMAPVDNRYDYIEAPRAPVREARYVEPVAPAAPVAEQPGERPEYRPYRPNR